MEALSVTGVRPGDDETDGGRPKAARTRTCIVTRESKSIEDLVRFVADPSGVLTPDLRASLPGRGVWVTAEGQILAEAVKRRAFSRALKREVTVPANLVEEVDALLSARAREALSLANKAGAVVTGFAKVETALSRRVAALLHASEAAADGKEKLDRRFRAVSGDDGLIVDIFSGDQMDLALGRMNVVHAALVGGPAATACISRIRSLLRYRRGGLSPQGTPARRRGGTNPAAGTDRT